MTHTDLKQLFQIAGKTARDFIRWAESHGVKVHACNREQALGRNAGNNGAVGAGVWMVFFHSRITRSLPTRRD